MTPIRLSASQISTYEMCPRKWAWDKLDKQPRETNRFAALGKRVHKELEQWFRHGMTPDFGGSPKEAEIAQAMLVHLPPPTTPGLEVEIMISLELDDIPFLGYIDLRQLHGRPRPLVCDHKTSGDMRWALTPETLPGDVQATLYALDTMQEAECDAVDLQWTYGTTKGRPKGLPVCRTVTAEDIAERIEKTTATANEIRLIKESGIGAIDVAYDGGGCEAYGGCPFEPLCNLSARERIGSIMSQEKKKNDFLKDLADRKAARAAGTHPPAMGAPVNPPPPTTPAPPPAEPTAAQVVATAKKAAAAEKRKAKKAAKEAKAAEAAATPPAEPPPVQTTVFPPAKTVVNPPEAVGAAVEDQPISYSLAGFTLYVDCAPVKGEPVFEHAEVRIAHVIAELRKATGVVHYKIVDFGKGVGLFADGIARDLVERPPQGGVYINTNSNEARDALQAFVNAAAVVIQGG